MADIHIVVRALDVVLLDQARNAVLDGARVRDEPRCYMVVGSGRDVHYCVPFSAHGGLATFSAQTLKCVFWRLDLQGPHHILCSNGQVRRITFKRPSAWSTRSKRHAPTGYAARCRSVVPHDTSQTSPHAHTPLHMLVASAMSVLWSSCLRAFMMRTMQASNSNERSSTIFFSVCLRSASVSRRLPTGCEI